MGDFTEDLIEQGMLEEIQEIPETNDNHHLYLDDDEGEYPIND